MKLKYAFTRGGVAAFLDSVLGVVFYELDNGGENVPDICITVGDREIVIPMTPEQYEELSEYLNNAITIEEENG